MPPKTRKVIAPPVVTVRKKPKQQDPDLVARKSKTKSSPVQQPQAAPPRPSAPSPVPQSPPQAELLLAPAPPSEASPSPLGEHEPSPAVESGPSPAPLNRRQRDLQARKALLEVFQTRWPSTFPRDFRRLKPWALRIHKDLAAALPGTPVPLIRDTVASFRRWTGDRYWRAVREGGPRYDLEGNVCGVVTPEEQERAEQDLKAFYEQKKAKRQTARVPEGAQPQGTPAAATS
jgi:ProP effector